MYKYLKTRILYIWHLFFNSYDNKKTLFDATHQQSFAS